MIDIGVNLNSAQFDIDRVAVIERARAAGIVQQILISSDLDETGHCLALAEQFDLYATAGVHPHQAKTWNADSAAVLRTQLAHPRAVAVGECGLDFNRNFSAPVAQVLAFTEQLTLAAALHKPVYMHCRDAHQEWLQLVSQFRSQLPAAVLHCFTGTERELRDCLDLDIYIGITGWINDERRGAALLAMLPLIPLDRLLLETDAPYLRPRDLPNSKKNRRNEPCNLPHIAATVARRLGMAVADLCAQTQSNSERLFGIFCRP